MKKNNENLNLCSLDVGPQHSSEFFLLVYLISISFCHYLVLLNGLYSGDLTIGIVSCHIQAQPNSR